MKYPNEPELWKDEELIGAEQVITAEGMSVTPEGYALDERVLAEVNRRGI